MEPRCVQCNNFYPRLYPEVAFNSRLCPDCDLKELDIEVAKYFGLRIELIKAMDQEVFEKLTQIYLEAKDGRTPQDST